MLDIKRKPKMGLFLLAPERFTKLGEGTARGSYFERKQHEAEWMVESCKTIADVTFTGVTFSFRRPALDRTSGRAKMPMTSVIISTPFSR